MQSVADLQVLCRLGLEVRALERPPVVDGYVGLRGFSHAVAAHLNQG